MQVYRLTAESDADRDAWCTALTAAASSGGGGGGGGGGTPPPYTAAAAGGGKMSKSKFKGKSAHFGLQVPFRGVFTAFP